MSLLVRTRGYNGRRLIVGGRARERANKRDAGSLTVRSENGEEKEHVHVEASQHEASGEVEVVRAVAIILPVLIFSIIICKRVSGMYTYVHIYACARACVSV